MAVSKKKNEFLTKENPNVLKSLEFEIMNKAGCVGIDGSDAQLSEFYRKLEITENTINIVGLGYKAGLEEIKKIYPKIHDYKTVSNVYFEDSSLIGTFTKLRIKDITILVNLNEVSCGLSSVFKKTIIWDTNSYLLLYLLTSEISENGIYEGGGTVIPSKYKIDGLFFEVETTKINTGVGSGDGFFKPTNTPTNKTIQLLYNNVLNSKVMEIEFFYNSFECLLKSTWYIPFIDIGDDSYRKGIIEDIISTAFTGG